MELKGRRASAAADIQVRMFDAGDDAVGQLLLQAAVAPLGEGQWLDAKPRAIAYVDWWMKVKEALISENGR